MLPPGHFRYPLSGGFGAVTDRTVSMKFPKVPNTRSIHRFVPVEIETSVAFGRTAMILLKELGEKVRENVKRRHFHLLKRILVAI